MSDLYIPPKIPVTVVQLGGSNNFSAAPNTAGTAVNIGIGGNIFTNNATSVTTARINNLGVGGNVFASNTSGINNIGVGGNVFGSNATGSYNTGVGNNSGNGVLGSYNTMLGTNTGQAAIDGNVYNNSAAIGYGAIVSASNQIVLGTATESVVIPSITPSNTGGTGALVVGGGVGIRGNLYLGGLINTNQNVENMNYVSWSTNLTVSFNNTMIYYLYGTPNGPITTLTINDVPTNVSSYFCSTFTFVVPTSNMSWFITASSNFYVNNTVVTLRGVASISGNLNASNPVLILQQITLFYINGTIQNAITMATAY